MKVRGGFCGMTVCSSRRVNREAAETEIFIFETREFLEVFQCADIAFDVNNGSSTAFLPKCRFDCQISPTCMFGAMKAIQCSKWNSNHGRIRSVSSSREKQLTEEINGVVGARSERISEYWIH